ncbi:MAG: LLM class flavin-dependent oxidoreductase [Alphaproteobacteria bacterium]|nr:LLM class flavin-dependent oxidoreductase [Alphaproteobacteria bacterium]
MSLSVLDQSIACAGQGQDEAIRQTLRMAEWCERLGYRRFWVSEHHNHPSIVGSAPEILVAAIAARTRSIRVGTAGVMLPHYSPYKVAEQFRVLEALAPGRIDLGLGRAPGSDQLTAYALNPDAATRADRFPEQVRDLMQWVSGGEMPEGHPFSRVRATPGGPGQPEIWMLGSSDFGARLAGHFGLPYSFAHFITDGRGCESVLELYRRSFRPGLRLAEPHAGLCVWALAADTEAEARHLFRTRERWRIERDRGNLTAMLPPEAAVNTDLTPAEEAALERLRATALVGTGAQVAARIRELAARTGAAEIAILTWTFDAQARRRSYELLAREFGLLARAA